MSPAQDAYARDPLQPRVLVVGAESSAQRDVAQMIDQTDGMLLQGTVSTLAGARTFATPTPPTVAVVVRRPEDPPVWRTLAGLCRPPLHLPVVFVAPPSLRETGFLFGAEDWVPLASLTPALLERAIANTSIRRRIAGGLPSQNHLHGLVTGMAHEVNNPLTVIIADIEEIRERLEDQRQLLREEAMQEELDDLCEMLSDDLVAANRIRTLARSMQDLARLADTLPCALHTGPAMRRVLERVRQAYPQAPPPEIQGSTETRVHAAVLGFEEAMYQVLVNAIQAHEQAGTRQPVRIEVEAHDALVEFRVRDSGQGVPEELQSTLLSPFKSGRPPGEGLGLGLSLAALALRRAGGDVAVRPGPDGGTEVVLAFLPGREGLSPMLSLDDEDDGLIAAR